MLIARHALGAMAAGCIVLLALACAPNNRNVSPAKQTHKLDLTSRKALYGGDVQAWLTQCGDNADSSFCRAKLRLPLAHDPAWVASYSPAQFSRVSPLEIVHYNGALAVGARCPQIMLLDTKTGAELFNNIRYEGRLDPDTAAELSVFFVNPAGLLLARDQLNRTYCFDMLDAKLPRLWLSNESSAGNDRVYVTQGNNVIMGGGGRIRGASISDGAERWSYPSLLPNQGKVLSRDGVLVWWSNLGEAGALDADSGKLLWRISPNCRISRIIIDDRNGTFFLARDDEKLECRDLQSGKLRWEYSWAGVLTRAERDRVISRLRTQYRVPVADVMLLCRNMCCIPQGVCLCLPSGHVLALNTEGKLLWQAKTSQPISTAVAFDNGLLVLEEYSKIGARQEPGEFLPFMLDPPDWPSYKNADATRKNQGLFNRITILNIETGAIVDNYEPPLGVSCWPVPAYNMVILGMEKDGAVQSSVRAYPWLEPQGF